MKNVSKKKGIFLYDDHKRPVTRRDFLAAGLLQFSGFMTLPPLAAMLASQANAQTPADCPRPDPLAAGMSAFVTINCSGGAGLASNIIPLNAGGQMLASYDRLGLGAPGALTVVREFNNVAFPGGGVSGILTGITNTTTVETRANTSFVWMPNSSSDDTNSNTLMASGMVQKAGLLGSILPSLGRRATQTGVSQNFSTIKPSNPLTVNSLTDITNALGAAGALARLNAGQKTSLFRMIASLSGRQSERVMALSGGETLKKLVGCASGQNVELIQTGGGNVDPRSVANVAAVWGIQANTAANNGNVVAASMTFNALNGQAGSIGLEIGGCDYHDNSRTSGNSKDLEIGTMIGRVLQTAAVLQKPVFIQVCSDGSVVSEISTSSTSPWVSDRGSAGIIFMIAYSPTARPATSGFQIGSFNAGQAADGTFAPGTGSNTARAAAAVFANYMAFNKKANMIESVIPGMFSAAQLSQVLKFT